MKLIGMLDSPYVRRVAISLQLLGIDFEHEPLSVFRTFEAFQQVNPVVKAPTLVCDDGTVLMDSTLILAHAELLARGRRSLMPSSLEAHCRALRLIGLALAACEKSVQIIYETQLRPPEKQHEPWLVRVRGQLAAALDGLEGEFAAQPPPAPTAATMDQAGLTSAVAWHFVQAMRPELADPARCPRLAAHADAAETLPAFIAAPHGTGVVARATSAAPRPTGSGAA